MMTSDEMLARMGLQRSGGHDFVLPALGLFGTGLLVGAGLGLLFAPRPGSELREVVGDRATRLAARLRRRSDEALEALTRDELYQRATELDIQGRSQMTKDELLDAVRSH